MCYLSIKLFKYNFFRVFYINNYLTNLNSTGPFGIIEKGETLTFTLECPCRKENFKNMIGTSCVRLQSCWLVHADTNLTHLEQNLPRRACEAAEFCEDEQIL